MQIYTHIIYTVPCFYGVVFHIAKVVVVKGNVIVLPGTCFGFPNSFRVVFCSPVHILIEAAHRIGQFCHRHLSGVK
jgi:aspartate/methionine/tyrosine aminotransferase